MALSRSTTYKSSHLPSEPNQCLAAQTYRKSPSSSRSVRQASLNLPKFLIQERSRLACAEYDDVFSIMPGNLKDWYMPESLWTKLPEDMQSAVSAMQHAGAAVTTSFDRIDRLKEELGDQLKDCSDELHSIPSLASLPLWSGMLSSGATSPNEFLETPPTPIAHFDLSRIDDKSASPWLSSPVLLGARPRRNSTVLPPLHPRLGQWKAEVLLLREENMTRLRHAVRRVYIEWSSCIQDSFIGHDFAEHHEIYDFSFNFEAWMSQKKALVRDLEEKCNMLGYVVLGWGGAWSLLRTRFSWLCESCYLWRNSLNK